MFFIEAEFRDFLRKAHASTYAGGDKNRLPAPSRPGSTEYQYGEGEFLYHDVYFGSRDFIGQEVVYHYGIPVWAMNYHGCLAPQVEKSVGFVFLRKALLAGAESGEALRGPKEWIEGEFVYTCDYEGHHFTDDLFSFNGQENIYRKTNNYHGGIYRCYFHGGVIS